MLVILSVYGIHYCYTEQSLVGGMACQACMLSNKPDDSVARLRQNLCHR